MSAQLLTSPEGACACVDIFNATLGSWSKVDIAWSAPGMSATSLPLHQLAFFAGGALQDTFSNSKIVDIFNGTSGSWSTAALSQERSYFSAASLTGLVLFAGGVGDFGEAVD